MESAVEDKTCSSIPLILVSAYDLASANVLISEIININAQDENKTQNKSESRIWKIENKYYTAEVELYPLADKDTLPLSLADRLEAHIIYITSDEEDEMAGSRAEERWARAAGGEASVRLLASAAAGTAPSLAAWARRRRYEPVPLREAPAPEDDAGGVRRVREALNAHAWRGLRRVDGTHEADGGSEDEVEAFAAALGALRQAREEGAALPTAERRRAAERHTLAFLRSIGIDVHTI